MTVQSEILSVLPPELADLLQQDGFVILVSGGKEHGKTNFCMLLAEICKYGGLRRKFATNISVNSYFMEKIDNKPDLEKWLKTGGKKLYVMDELGKILKRLGFATKGNKGLMDIIQLIRHYDCGFIGSAPSAAFVDSNFMNDDILDAHIKKLNKKTARVIDKLHRCNYFFNDIPPTSIPHNGKDIATFTFEKPRDVNELKRCCQAAAYFAKTGNLTNAGKFFNPPLVPMQVKRLLIEHCKHEIST